jgi:hypothetical protein
MTSRALRHAVRGTASWLAFAGLGAIALSTGCVGAPASADPADSRAPHAPASLDAGLGPRSPVELADARASHEAGRSTDLDGQVHPSQPDAQSPGERDSGRAACASLIPPLPSTTGPSIHVAPTGSDATGNGSLAQPFATLGRAVSNAVPGTRVVLAGGSYCHSSGGAFDATYCPTDFMSLRVNGTAAEPVVITAEPGQSPVFDFSLLTNAAYGTEAAITFSSSSHLVVDSIELQNSPNGGITFGGSSSFCTLTRSKLHDLQFQAIVVMGSDFIIAGNETYNLVLESASGQPAAGYWPSCNFSWFASGDESNPSGWTERVQWLANDVHDCWGEGINALFADTVDIIGNDVHDIYSHKIYLDHGRNARILRNSLYQTSASSYAGGPNAGVAIDDEVYAGVDYMHEDNILIANNYFGPNLFRTLFRFDTGTGAAANSNINNTWSNVHFVFNVVEPSLLAFAKVLGDGSGVIAPSGGVIADNIFLGQPTFELGDPGAWTMSNNSFPASLEMSAFGGDVPALSGSFVAAPIFVGPTDGSTLAGFVPTNSSAFQVAYDGPLVEMPSSMPNYSLATFLDRESLVLQDYECQNRTLTTTAGLFQP